MEGRRPLIQRLSLLLSEVYHREKEGSSCGGRREYERLLLEANGGVWVEKNSKREEDVCVRGVCGTTAAWCVCVDGLCPQFPGKGGSHQRGGRETLTGLTSCSSPDGWPDSQRVCVCVPARAHV